MPPSALPWLATVLVGLAHVLAWRDAFGVSAWAWLGLLYAPLVVLSWLQLRRDGVLGTLLRPVPGDAARGIAGAALGVAVVYGVARIALRVTPDVVARDLLGLIRVAIAVPTAPRAAAIVAFAFVEELVWRGAVTHALEGPLGSRRAPWAASALFVVAVIPSMHPALIVAGVCLGVVTALLRSMTGRLSVPIVVHAAFTWITVEMILPSLWEKIRALG